MSHNDLLKKTALEYISRGVSVLVAGKNKIPLIAWKEFTQRIPTKEEVISWFDMFPEGQLGIITGRISNLTVVDIEKGGDPSFLPQNTPIVKTGGGGWHYFFLYEQGVMNSARIRPLTDIRSENGYIMAPPSFSDKGQYSVIKSVPLLPFPKELFGLKNRLNLNENNTNSKIEVEEYPGYGKGQRNDMMTRYIGSVLTRIHPSDWDKLAWPIVQTANTKNNPPLPEYELKNTFNSILQAEKRNSPERWKNKTNSVSVRPEWDSATGDDIVLMSEVAASQSINIDDVHPLGYDVFDKAILGGSTPGDLIVVSGQTSHGKTSFCQSLTYNFIKRGEKVLWFSYEVLMSYLWKKFETMGMNAEDFIFAPFKNTTGNVGWVEKKIKEAKQKYGIKMVVIDHLGFLMPKMSQNDISRNYAAYIGQIVREIKTLAIQEEIIIVLPVHMRKTEDPNINDLRDSSSIGQESDLVFVMDRIKAEGNEALTEYYTMFTKISLMKNRKTGKSVVGKFKMLDERFWYDESETMKPEQKYVAVRGFKKTSSVNIDERIEGKKKNAFDNIVDGKNADGTKLKKLATQEEVPF